MAYAYYHRLSKNEQKIYRASDALDVVQLSDKTYLKTLIKVLEEQLAQGDVNVIERCCQELVDTLCQQLKFVDVRVHVLERRPHNDFGELHGLYEPIDRAHPKAVIYVWMRTAKRQKIVAFKTFLRTLIHEYCHHLDFEYYKLKDSFHTQGFFQRESELVKQLLN